MATNKGIVVATDLRPKTDFDDVSNKLPEAVALEAELAFKMRALLSRFATKSPGRGDDARRAAEALVEKAYDEDNPRAAFRWIQEALILHPDCVVAYIHLADRSIELETAAEWLAKAVSSGARELGPEVFANPLASFRQIAGAGDYLRAKHRLGETLWRLERFQEAVEHFQGLLKLNPRDDQGVRHALAAAFLELGRNSEAEALLLAYEKESSTPWEFHRALTAFRREGDTVFSRNQLQRAKKTNQYVEIYLTGIKTPPKNRLNWIDSDLEFEAMEFVEVASKSWSSTPGAMAWIKS